MAKSREEEHGAGTDPPASCRAIDGSASGAPCSRKFVDSRSAGDDRQRDLLPLPVPHAMDVDGVEAPVYRNVRRRLTRAASSPWLLRQAVLALNGMFGSGGVPLGDDERQPTLGQRCALQRLAGDVAALGPCPGDLRPWEALRELQASPCYDGESVSMVPLKVSCVSLPPAGSSPVPLADLLGREASDALQREITGKLLQKTQVDCDKKEAGFGKPFLDPSLRDQARYSAMVLRLLQSGVVDLVSDESLVRDTVGMFAVPKKSGRQRLVIDARPANFWFGQPAPVSLAAGAALAHLELPDGAALWTATADVADAFYNMELPTEWRPFSHCLRLPVGGSVLVMNIAVSVCGVGCGLASLHCRWAGPMRLPSASRWRRPQRTRRDSRARRGSQIAR